VLGDRIVRLGQNDEIESLARARTRVIDGSGKLLLPGFNDAHVHFVDGGLALTPLQLNDATSADEFARRIAERGPGTPEGRVGFGGEWDEDQMRIRPECRPKN